MKFILFSAISLLFLIDDGASEDISCDRATQETCYDENSSPVSCANISDGGCPCPSGEVKCGAYQGYAGYCTAVCCDFINEETCYNETTWQPSHCAKISDGGCPCPPDQVRCGVSQYSIGYCTDTCCDWATQETCYNPRTRTTRCASIVEGGCSCPNGQVRCGETETDPGYCADVCCDPVTEETCYDEDSNPSSCSPIEEGCPCPEGESRCGAFEGFPGVCTTLCCDSSTEETCYGENWEPLYCAKRAEGGCPCPGSQTRCGASTLDPGYCTDVCCDLLTEEACYDSTSIDQLTPSYCAKISDGGCPCSNSDEVKCGASEYYAGYCTRVCCDWRYEQPCYDDNNVLVGCAFAGGQCPSYGVSESSEVPTPNPIVSFDSQAETLGPSYDEGSSGVPSLAPIQRRVKRPTFSHDLTEAAEVFSAKTHEMDARKKQTISPAPTVGRNEGAYGMRPTSSYDVTSKSPSFKHGGKSVSPTGNEVSGIRPSSSYDAMGEAEVAISLS